MVGASIAEGREPGQPEDEPFDVVRASSSLDDGYETRRRRTPRKMTPTNEVGDLPTLSRNPGSSVEGSTIGVNDDTESKARSLTRKVTGGQEARTRPMSPPSRAGLDDPDVFQKNQTRQRNRKGDYGEEDDETEGMGSKSNDSKTNSTGTFSRSFSTREMPMDERQEYEDEMKALALCDLGEGSQGLPEFCDTAMTAVNEMCGGATTASTETPNRSNRDHLKDMPELTGISPRSKKLLGAPNNRPKRELKLGEKHTASTGVEEQTAIEVEYVEPLYRGKYGTDENDRYASPKRKNALLKAMTRKAKDDWKGKAMNREPEKAPPPEETEDQQGNVYSTFTAAEKRKFLQLINGGNTPFEATNRVMRDRLENPNPEVDNSVADSSFMSEEKSLPRSPSRGLGKLKFWKRGSKASKEEQAASPASARSPVVDTSVLGGQDNEANNEIYEDNASDDSGSSCEKVGDEIKKFLRDEAESVKAESEGQRTPQRTPQQQTPRSQSNDEEESEMFEKSGINYYDAVRKDRSIDDEDDYYNDGEYPEDRRQTRKLKIPKGFKAGFSKLRGSDAPVMESHRSIPSPATEQIDEEKEAAEESKEDQPQPQTSFDEEKKAEEDFRIRQKAAEGADGDAIEAAMAAQLLGNLSNAQMQDVDQPTPKSPDQIIDDLNMDAYLGSTESLRSYGASGSFDATSVVSSKSYKTSNTNYTTQSTRQRRRGRAKIKLEQEKVRLEQEKRDAALNASTLTTTSSFSRGWQESIEEAAKKTGKVWKPETGWENYVDPNRLETASVDQGVNSGDYNPNPENPENLTAWKDTKRPPPPTPPRSTTPSKKKTSPSRKRRSPSKKAATASTTSPDRARGWAATMKAATAKLSKQGKKWDPEKGWTGLDEDEVKSMTDGQIRESQEIAMTASSDMQDFGMMTAVQQLDEIANKQDTSGQFLSEEEEAEAEVQHGMVGDASTTDGDMSSSAKSKSGRYIQIAESGSVKEFQRKTGRPVVVRKQNLNQDDADFFPEGSAHFPSKGPVDMDDVYEQESKSFDKQTKYAVLKGPGSNAKYQKIYESQGNGSFDDVATDFSFDADEATEHVDNTLDTRKAVPRLKIKIRDVNAQAKSVHTQSEASFESNTSIPKLAAPKRDTSPVRSGGKSRTPKSSSEKPPRPITPSQSQEQQQQQSQQQQSQQIFRDSPQEEEEVPSQHQQQQQLMTVGKETIALSPVVKREMMAPAESPSKVRELHKMWEKKTKSWDKSLDKDDSPPEDLEDARNSEWKSFLAKKVLAESAAAAIGASQDDRDSVFDDLGDAPQRRRSQRRPGEPADGAAFDDLSELSPIRHDSDSEYGRGSEIPSETSTSVLQGTTFMQRLQACAAPMVTKGTQFAQNQNCSSGEPISSHLAFLRTNTAVGGNPGDRKAGILHRSAELCGRPNTISEVGEDETASMEQSTNTPTKSPQELKQEQRARSRSRSNQRSRQNDEMSSVVSEGFGSSSAYLDAIAMKAATGGGKKKKKRPQGSEASASTGPTRSEVSGSTAGNSKHSEKFQQFLDRRASKEAEPSRVEASNLAEKRASEKIDQMLDTMAGRDSRGRVKEDYEETGAFPTLPVKPNPAIDASRLAAEELAAARVEVMMQSLSSQKLADNEAEI